MKRRKTSSFRVWQWLSLTTIGICAFILPILFVQYCPQLVMSAEEHGWKYCFYYGALWRDGRIVGSSNFMLIFNFLFAISGIIGVASAWLVTKVRRIDWFCSFSIWAALCATILTVTGILGFGPLDAGTISCKTWWGASLSDMLPRKMWVKRSSPLLERLSQSWTTESDQLPQVAE